MFDQDSSKEQQANSKLAKNLNKQSCQEILELDDINKFKKPSLAMQNEQDPVKLEEIMRLENQVINLFQHQQQLYKQHSHILPQINEKYNAENQHTNQS